MEIYKSVAQSILVLENSNEGMARISALLNPHYRVRSLAAGATVLQECSMDPPDLILIDTTRPDNEGVASCIALKDNATTSAIPVILMTHDDDVEVQQLMYEIGAEDYITRPLCPPTLLSRIRAHMGAIGKGNAERLLSEFRAYEASKHKRQMIAMQEITLLALASLAETRDYETGNHLKRTQHYVFALGQSLMQNPRFSAILTIDRLHTLFKCAPLHDIGKVGIPDKILLKPGRYEPGEYNLMKEHPRLGRDAIQNAQDLVGDSSDFLEVAKEIVYSHHEKWDGSGYPQGLAGDAIPVSARLMALADVYDALVSRRVYKVGMPHAQAAELIVQGRGSQFDPDMVDAFLQLGEEFQGIALRYADSDQDLQHKEDLMRNAL